MLAGPRMSHRGFDPGHGGDPPRRHAGRPLLGSHALPGMDRAASFRGLITGPFDLESLVCQVDLLLGDVPRVGATDPLNGELLRQLATERGHRPCDGVAWSVSGRRGLMAIGGSRYGMLGSKVSAASPILRTRQCKAAASPGRSQPASHSCTDG